MSLATPLPWRPGNPPLVNFMPWHRAQVSRIWPYYDKLILGYHASSVGPPRHYRGRWMTNLFDPSFTSGTALTTVTKIGLGLTSNGGSSSQILKTANQTMFGGLSALSNLSVFWIQAIADPQNYKSVVRKDGECTPLQFQGLNLRANYWAGPTLLTAAAGCNDGYYAALSQYNPATSRVELWLLNLSTLAISSAVSTTTSGTIGSSPAKPLCFFGTESNTETTGAIIYASAFMARAFADADAVALLRSPLSWLEPGYDLAKRIGAVTAGGTVYYLLGRAGIGIGATARAQTARAAAVIVATGGATNVGASASRATAGRVGVGQAAPGTTAVARGVAGLAGAAIGTANETRVTRAGAGRSAAGASVSGSGSKISGAATAGMVAVSVALRGSSAIQRGAAGRLAGGVVSRAGTAALRSAVGKVGAGQAARAGFQVRRAVAGVVAQAAGHAGQVAARRALQGLIAQGAVLLLQARIVMPGNGLRRLTVVLDRRNLSTSRSVPVHMTETDTRHATVVCDTRRLLARKDD